MFRNQIPFAATLIVCLTIASLRAMELEIGYEAEEMLYAASGLLSFLCIIQLISTAMRKRRVGGS